MVFRGNLDVSGAANSFNKTIKNREDKDITEKTGGRRQETEKTETGHDPADLRERGFWPDLYAAGAPNSFNKTIKNREDRDRTRSG